MLGHLDAGDASSAVPHEEAIAEARAARAHSEAAIGEAAEKRDQIHRVAESLRGQRQANRFADRMGQTFRRRP